MASPDLRRYGEILDFLQDRQRGDEGETTDRSPSWGEATLEWGRDQLGLDDDALRYFLDGVNLLAAVQPKTRHWLHEAPQTQLDDEIWLYYRVWVDHYGPVYPTRRAF